MAKLGRQVLLLLVIVLAAAACSSAEDSSSVTSEDSIPTTTQDPDDPFRRVAGGVALVDSDGFLQLCFRLVDQDGELLCADARARFEPDDYVSFDGSQVGMEDLGDVVISAAPAWLYAAELDDGLHLELRNVGQGEVIQ